MLSPQKIDVSPFFRTTHKNEGYKVTMNLPPAATAKGKRYFFKKYSTNAAGNKVTIDPNGTERIDGSLTTTITAAGTKYGGIMVVSNGTEWFIYSSYGN